ncbi:MAG: D-glucuronyl C5-epimerase family protein [Candidatus Hydrothermarchaeales archaeon]
MSKYSIVGDEIPLIYYGTVDGVYLGYQEAPHATAQVAREAFYAYEKTGNTENLSRALVLVDHLLNTTVDRRDYMVWEYAFPWPGYSLEKGWRGSLCQAGILKSLMLAYKHTGEERYRHASQKTLNAFTVPVEEGGLLKLREGYAWYPEYVKETPPYVLNGFITSLIWIREYHDFTANPLAEELFNEGISSLIHFLPTYNLEKGSYYDAIGHKATPKYHSLHVSQMKTLFGMTGDPIFQEYYLKWNESV